MRSLFYYNNCMTQEERLNWLIIRLEKENNRYADIDSLSYEEKKKRLRALFNVRPPRPVSDEFLSVQDEYLKYEIKEKGITDYLSLEPVKEHLYLWEGDITTLKCDAIVNAANGMLLGCFVPGHLCVDNCIHTFSGIQLRLECCEIMKKRNMKSVETGEAILTKAYNLPSEHVIHTVGPIVEGKPTREDARLLASCYENSLELAAENNMRSIAFSSISTSSFGFPMKEACRIALDTVLSFVKNHQIDVILDFFGGKGFEICQEILK